MKTLYILFTTILVTTFTFSQTTELFFSMYGEGSASNRFLEIYNGTGASIDLGTAGYSIELYIQGKTVSSYQLVFSAGTLINNNDVFVLVSPYALAELKAKGDLENSVSNFNGESSITLLKNGVLVDLIGEIGADPWGAFRVGNYAWGSEDYTLIRKPTICGPNNLPLGSFGTTSSNTEWLVYPINSEWDKIGAHTINCSTASIEDNEISKSLSVYPNPVNNHLQLKLSTALEFKKAAIYNYYGQLVLQSKRTIINVSNLSSGIYFLEIETNKGKGIKKFIKK